MSRFSPFAASSVLALGLAPPACVTSSATVTRPDLEPTAVSVSDEAILPAAAAFEEATAELDGAIGSLCEAPDEALVESARESWRAASRSWNRFGLYDFGPLAEGLTPPHAFIDSFQAFGQGKSYVGTVRQELKTLVAEGTDLSGEDLSSWNFQRVGLLAIEVALFETATDEPDTAASAVAGELVANPNKCTYLAAQGALLAERAAALHLAWEEAGDDYRATFLQDANEALGSVFVAVHAHLEYLDKRSIAAQGAPVSGASFDNIAATLDEVEVLLAAGGGNSLAARLTSAHGADLVADHAADLSAARAAIANEDADALGASLIDLAKLYQDGIPATLTIQLGLNFNDGD